MNHSGKNHQTNSHNEVVTDRYLFLICEFEAISIIKGLSGTSAYYPSSSSFLALTPLKPKRSNPPLFWASSSPYPYKILQDFFQTSSRLKRFGLGLAVYHISDLTKTSF